MPIPRGGAAGYGAGPEGVYSEGEIYPTRQAEMVQAAAGMRGSMGAFRPLAPFGASPDGIGNYQPRAIRGGSLGGSAFGSPLLAAVQTISNRRQRGLGDDLVLANDPFGSSGLILVALALGLGITAVSGYYAGKAMAPSSAKVPKYAWWGVASALVLGPVGLGIEAAVALNHKGG